MCWKEHVSTESAPLCKPSRYKERKTLRVCVVTVPNNNKWFVCTQQCSWADFIRIFIRPETMFEPGPDGDTRIGYGMAMCNA